MTRELRQGNTYTDTPTIALTNDDGTPFQLSGSTCVLTAKTQAGMTIWQHTLAVSIFGVITTSNGLTIQGGNPATGIIINEISAVESAAMSGWVRWFLEVTDTTGNITDSIAGSWKVIPRTPYMVPFGISRLELRRRTLRQLGDLLIVRATADGSDATIIDQIHLIGEPNAYRGRAALFTDGVPENIGEQRYVTGSNRDNRSITFDFELPATTEIGDECELCNFRGTGYKFDDVHAALDAAIESASDFATEPAYELMSSAYNTMPGTMYIPDDWVAVGGVQWRTADDQPWQSMYRSNRGPGSGWSIDRANRTIVIAGSLSRDIDQSTIQVYGFRRPGMLVNDEDMTSINAEWLVCEAMSQLNRAAYLKNPTKERADMLNFLEAKSSQVRTRVTKRTGPDVVRL